MSYGTRSWMEDSQPDLDTTSKPGRYLGAVDTGGVNGSISVPGFVQGTPVFKVLTFSDNLAYVAPIVTISGTTLSWTYSGAANPAAARIVYGVGG